MTNIINFNRYKRNKEISSEPLNEVEIITMTISQFNNLSQEEQDKYTLLNQEHTKLILERTITPIC
jgi:hypothetical protein